MLKWLREKFNPAQREIAQRNPEETTNYDIRAADAVNKVEVLSRGTSMLVNAVASLDYDIKDSLSSSVVTIRKKSLHTLLNYRPNPYQSVQDFRTAIFTDFILEGNAFIYFDGAFIYHLPAANVVINADEKTFIKSYTYLNTTFKPEEVFHFRDLSSSSIYRGTSRLVSASRSIKALYNMLDFQDGFFSNGAVFGTIFVTDNTLSNVAKEKTIKYWRQFYSPKNGARTPVILDSGMKPYPLASTNFKDMDFDTAIKTHSEKLLQALGVPPILLAGGNNANISPNLRLFYLETVLPIARKFVSALERFFGYDVDIVVSNVSALQPDLKDIAGYYTTLVNGGIITPNEARAELRYEAVENCDNIRVPANIAGSAVDPTQGGRPDKGNT